VLLILNAVPVDVWLAITDLPPGELRIARLLGPTATTAGLGQRLGTDQDPTEFYATHGIAYHHIPGGEAQSLSDLLPDLRTPHRLLKGLSGTLRALFEREIAPWLADSATTGIRIQIANDHGCALSHDCLHHGGQTVYERLVLTCG